VNHGLPFYQSCKVRFADHSGVRRITLPSAVRQEQCLVVLFHTVSVASFVCRFSGQIYSLQAAHT
jgi:hypothetical protein